MSVTASVNTPMVFGTTGAYPPLPCRASPPQGGRSEDGDRPFSVKRTSAAQSESDRNVKIKARGQTHPISPLEGEMPGRAEGGSPARSAGFFQAKAEGGAKLALMIESSPC